MGLKGDSVSWPGFCSDRLSVWFDETVSVSLHGREDGKAAIFRIIVEYFRLEASN